MKAYITAPSQKQAEEEIVKRLNSSPNKDACCLAATIEDSEIFFGDGWFGEDGKTFEVSILEGHRIDGTAQRISDDTLIEKVSLISVKCSTPLDLQEAKEYTQP